MDLTKFTDFFKSYNSLLLPGIIGLVAVLLFIPTRLMSSKLKGKIEKESLSMWSSVNSLQNTVSKEQWKMEQLYQQRHQKDANTIANLVEQTTQRELLSYQIFPEPRETSHMLFYTFSDHFQKSIDELMKRSNAGECPSQQQLSEIDKGLDTSRSSKARGKLRRMGVSVRDKLCREKAESISIYANPGDIGVYQYWGEFNYSDRGRQKSVEDCWYSQLSYWIIEDVFNTVIKLNGSSQSVLDSPAKRILGIRFGKDERGSHLRSPRQQEVSFDKPYYVLSSQDVLAVPHTKRYSDEQIDVVHFKVSMVVSSSSILPLIQELCSSKDHTFKGWYGTEPARRYKHNQITVLEYNISPLTRREGKHDLYRYGHDPVVELELACEYIFVKEVYDVIKPKIVKDAVQKRVDEIEKQKRGSGRGRR